MSKTEELAALREDLARLEAQARQVSREADLSRRAVQERKNEVLSLLSEQAAGRDVVKALKAAQKTLEAAQKTEEEPWADRVFVARRAAELKRGDVSAFAGQHRDELWAERSPECDRLMETVEDLASQLDAALGALGRFAAESDQLCSLTGGSPRMDMPSFDVQPIRRAIVEAAAGLVRPMPVVAPIRGGTTAPAQAASDGSQIEVF